MKPMRIFMLPRCLTVLLSACLLPASSVALAKQKPVPPNILFIIMDDVGIDQLSAFGYGGTTPPALPNVNTIANKSVRFRNNWSMPACSPSRAVIFEGRSHA